MRNFPKLPFQMRRNQFIGLGILGILILVFQLVFYWFKNTEKHEPVVVEFVNENAGNELVLSEFNPNELTAEQWKDLGFTERQVKTILNYKELVGGEFLSKEQLAKCYAISSEKFAEIEAYILLPEKTGKKNNFENSFTKKELKISGKFNPDTYSAKDWENMGFSQKQAEAIIKYKNYLGGSFRSKEKFRECFIISPENYQRLAPYLLLPETAPDFAPKPKENKPKIEYSYFDPNALDVQGWQRLGFSEKQAQVIVNYRDKNLKGSFRSLEDIEKCFVISAEKFQELKPWIKLQIREKEESTKAVVSAKTDFSKIDLNSITFKQLVEFGFNEKAAASYLGYRKKLGGFADKQQVLETYNVDKDLARDLISTSPMDVSKIQKYAIIDVPEDFLKTHPYFRKYGEKIIFYRVSFPSEKEIFKKIKATPEEITKMKMYLK